MPSWETGSRQINDRSLLRPQLRSQKFNECAQCRRVLPAARIEQKETIRDWQDGFVKQTDQTPVCHQRSNIVFVEIGDADAFKRGADHEVRIVDDDDGTFDVEFDGLAVDDKHP